MSSLSPLPTSARLLSAVVGKRCLITVGTTNFDSLIRALDQPAAAQLLLHTLTQHGYTHLDIQIGNTCKYTPTHLPALSSTHGCTVVVHTILPSLHALLCESQLVISHAGAGSILETLQQHIPLIVIINHTLMHNHQKQLAVALAAQHYLYMGTVDTALTVIGKALEQLDRQRKRKEPGIDKEEEFVQEDESCWGEQGELVHADYPLRVYPPADNTGWKQLLAEEMQML